MPDMDLPKVDINQATPRTVPTGFLRNARDTRRGANDAINCNDPNKPLRLIGFSKNLINPSKAEPAKNEDTLNINLPNLAIVSARRCTESGFLAIHFNAANPIIALNKNPENRNSPENKPPKDFLVPSSNWLLIFFIKEGSPSSDLSSASSLCCNLRLLASSAIFLFSLSLSSSSAFSCICTTLLAFCICLETDVFRADVASDMPKAILFKEVPKELIPDITLVNPFEKSFFINPTSLDAENPLYVPPVVPL